MRSRIDFPLTRFFGQAGRVFSDRRPVNGRFRLRNADIQFKIPFYCVLRFFVVLLCNHARRRHFPHEWKAVAAG